MGPRMCKHVAAVLYGVGARLDNAPELLFTLRDVDHLELISQAVDAESLDQSIQGKSDAALAGSDLGEIFGIEIDLGNGAKAGPRLETTDTSMNGCQESSESGQKISPQRVRERPSRQSKSSIQWWQRKHRFSKRRGRRIRQRESRHPQIDPASAKTKGRARNSVFAGAVS